MCLYISFVYDRDRLHNFRNVEDRTVQVLETWLGRSQTKTTMNGVLTRRNPLYKDYLHDFRNVEDSSRTVQVLEIWLGRSHPHSSAPCSPSHR